MFINKKIIFLLTILISVFLLFFLFNILNFKQKINKSSYDDRCKEKAEFIVSESNKIIRIKNPYNLTISQLEEFSVRYYLFEYFLDYVRKTEFNKSSPLIDNYFSAIKKYKSVDDFTLTKLLPPEHKFFLEKKYRNLTMGGLYMLEDFDGDRIPELIAYSIVNRCTDELLIYYLKTSEVDFSKKKNYLEDIAVKIYDVDTKYDKYLKSNLNTLLEKNPKIELDRMKYGSATTLFKVNQKLLNQEELNNKDKYFNLKQKKRIIVSHRSVLNRGYLLNVSDDKKIQMYRTDDFEKVDLGFLKDKKFNNITCLQKLLGFSSKMSEFVICENNKIYIIQPIKLNTNILEITAELNNYSDIESFLLGSVADYNQDGIADIWISNKYHKNSKNIVVGYLAMLDGKSIKNSLLESYSKLNMSTIVKKEIIGNSEIPNSETSGFMKPTTGISYDLSPVGGDQNNDGINDLVILNHYSYGLAGSLHILSGKKIIKLKSKLFLNDRDFKYIIGSFLGYLGPGLHAGYDYNNDGYDDIAVGADVDHETGYSSGSIYILSGKKIFNAD